jgi:hypothetical protein
MSELNLTLISRIARSRASSHPSPLPGKAGERGEAAAVSSLSCSLQPTAYSLRLSAFGCRLSAFGFRNRAAVARRVRARMARCSTRAPTRRRTKALRSKPKRRSDSGLRRNNEREGLMQGLRSNDEQRKPDARDSALNRPHRLTTPCRPPSCCRFSKSAGRHRPAHSGRPCRTRRRLRRVSDRCRSSRRG